MIAVLVVLYMLAGINALILYQAVVQLSNEHLPGIEALKVFAVWPLYAMLSLFAMVRGLMRRRTG